MSVEHNYKVYRETVAQDAVGNSPVVPYLPAHLRDVLTVHEVEAALTPAGNVSLPRMKKLAAAMHQVRKRKSCCCCFLRRKQVLRFTECKVLSSKNVRLHDFLASQVAFLSEEKLDTLSTAWRDRLEVEGNSYFVVVVASYFARCFCKEWGGG